MQPQGHFQVAINTIDYKLNPQAALDAPRWQWIKGKTVHVEPEFPNHLAQALTRLGHDIHVQHSTPAHSAAAKSSGEIPKQASYQAEQNQGQTERLLYGK